MSVVHITEERVKELLDWPLVCDAVEQALRAICANRTSDEQPISQQPIRNFTPTEKGVLLCMPGFIGKYKLAGSTKVFNTLGCKLVSSFIANRFLNPPKPNIMANIFLFSEETGQLNAVIGADDLTAWQTAAASMVATKYLYSKRPSTPAINTVAILGCGVEGRIHAIGFCTTNFVDSIYLWNRTISRAEALVTELKQLRHSFKNPNVQIICGESVADCVKNADVIVTATYADTPFLYRSMIKDNVHINATGAGEKGHHSELAEDIYTDPESKIYVDTIAGARIEFHLKAPIVCEIGDIINGHNSTPTAGITIFHSMGLGVEDAACGQAILEKFRKKLN